MNIAKITAVDIPPIDPETVNDETVYSYNVLVIKYFEIKMEDRFDFGEPEKCLLRLQAKMHAELQFICPKTGHKIQWFDIDCKGKGYDPHEAVRECLQYFLDGKYYNVYRNISENGGRVDRVSRKLHHIDYSMIPEPYYSLLQQIFSSDMWDIDKLQLTA